MHSQDDSDVVQPTQYSCDANDIVVIDNNLPDCSDHYWSSVDDYYLDCYYCSNSIDWSDDVFVETDWVADWFAVDLNVPVAIALRSPDLNTDLHLVRSFVLVAVDSMVNECLLRFVDEWRSMDDALRRQLSRESRVMVCTRLEDRVQKVNSNLECQLLPGVVMHKHTFRDIQSDIHSYRLQVSNG